MALWLFRRKSRRKGSRASSPGAEHLKRSAPPRSFTVPEGMAATAALSSSPIRRRSSNRKQRHEPNKLQRRARTYSFESGRADDLEIAWKNAGRGTTKRSTHSPLHASGALAGARNSDDSLFDNSRGAVLDRIPTLHHSSKRDGQHLLSRTKSSKRRKNAHNREREAEIKAMSNSAIYNDGNDFTPVRPAAEPWTAGRPMKRETMKTHPNSFAARYGRDKEKQPSDISLPNAESIDSAMSSDSEQIAYVVSPYAAFAPKPTLRYASQPRIGPPSGGSLPKRIASQKRKLSMPIPEATLKAHKRVDDLANDMTTSDLRELMERDKRRRDKKRLHDEERAARRLARQADRQQRLEAQPSSAGPSASGQRASPDMARGVLGREAVGLGIDTTSAVMTSATRRESPPLPTPPQRDSSEFGVREQQQHGDEPQQASLGGRSTGSAVESNADIIMSGANNDSAASSRRRASPVDMYHRPDSIPMAPAELELPVAATQAAEKRTEPTPVPARTNSRLRKLAKLRKRLSTSSSLLEERDSIGKTNAAITRKASHSSSSRGPLSWGALGALFRWRPRSKRGSGPSSFSNMSRDSMAAQSSIQRSHNFVESGSQAQLQHAPQNLIETPAAVSAAVAMAATAGPVSSTASADSTANATNAPANAHPLKAKGNVPKRTMSRFREDLPDFLISPPASRVQSPEAEPPLPVLQVPEKIDLTAPEQGTSFINDDHDDDESIILTPTAYHQQQQPKSSYDSNSMGNSATNGTRDTPTSWLRIDETEPSPEPQQSLSLASIDSEGSWLSGRVAARRRATQPQKSLDSVSRSSKQQQQQQQPLHRHRHDQSWTSNDTGSSTDQRPLSPTAADLISAAQATIAASGAAPADEDESSIVVDDEYLSRLAHSSAGAVSRPGAKRESTGEMLPSSDEEMDTVNGEADDARWGSVTEKRVAQTIVPAHVANLVKSREGLMKSFYDGEEGSDIADSPISPVSLTSPISQASSEFKDEEAGLQRATSINLGRGHVRHISAGSAKLLEISPSPRSSVDAKGRSREPLF